MDQTLVFQVLATIPGIADAGDFIVCEAGAIPPECDMMRVTPIPRGRLGHLLGAAHDDLIRLCDPPVSGQAASELLSRLVPPASLG